MKIDLVEDLGVKAGGRYDCGPAFKEAIDELKRQRDGELVLGRGRFLVKGGLEFDKMTGVRLVGTGTRHASARSRGWNRGDCGTAIYTPDSKGYAVRIANSGGIRFENLTIDARGSAGCVSLETNVRGYGAAACVFDQVNFEGGQVGMDAGMHGKRRANDSDCEFRSCRFSSEIPLRTSHSQAVIFHFYGCRFTIGVKVGFHVKRGGIIFCHGLSSYAIPVLMQNDGGGDNTGINEFCGIKLDGTAHRTVLYDSRKAKGSNMVSFHDVAHINMRKHTSHGRFRLGPRSDVHVSRARRLCDGSQGPLVDIDARVAPSMFTMEHSMLPIKVDHILGTLRGNAHYCFDKCRTHGLRPRQGISNAECWEIPHICACS